jgi:hypothetical protein
LDYQQPLGCHFGKASNKAHLRTFPPGDLYLVPFLETSRPNTQASSDFQLPMDCAITADLRSGLLNVSTFQRGWGISRRVKKGESPKKFISFIVYKGWIFLLKSPRLDLQYRYCMILKNLLRLSELI